MGERRCRQVSPLDLVFMCPRQSSARFFSARLHMTNVARESEHSMRARKKLLPSCSLLKETIFRRGLDADRGIGDIVHRYLASRRRMVFLLTTESVFQGCSGLFLHGSLPRHARCATRGSIETSLLLRNKRDDQRYESSLDSDNLLCAVRLCILSDTMRNGTHSISHGALEKMGGTCPSKLCRTYPLCGYEGRSLTLGLDVKFFYIKVRNNYLT
jgi:hypothetical protein